MAEAAFIHVDDSGRKDVVGIPLSGASVVTLLEHTIVAIEVTDARRTLQLRFSNGHLLRLESDSAYESFHLNLNGREIIV